MVVGPREALACSRVRVAELNWLGDAPPPPEGLPVTVKLRSAQPAVPARLRPSAVAGEAEVILAAPQFGVAPGQACVAYQGDRLLGGGWIARSDSES